MEPVFELMDLFLAQAYSKAFKQEDGAIINLRVHKEQFGEWVDSTTTFGEKREEVLLQKIQATQGVLDSALDWYVWRRAWYRMVP